MVATRKLAIVSAFAAFVGFDDLLPPAFWFDVEFPMCENPNPVNNYKMYQVYFAFLNDRVCTHSAPCKSTVNSGCAQKRAA
jgi:hypothetical protein